MGAIQNSVNAALGLGAMTVSKAADQKIATEKMYAEKAIAAGDFTEELGIKQTTAEQEAAQKNYDKAESAKQAYEDTKDPKTGKPLDKRKKEYRQLKSAANDAAKNLYTANIAKQNAEALAELRKAQKLEWSTTLKGANTISAAKAARAEITSGTKTRTEVLNRAIKPGYGSIADPKNKADSDATAVSINFDPKGGKK